MSMQSRRSFIFSGVLAVGGSVAGVHFYNSKYVRPEKRVQVVHGVIENLARLPGAVRFGNIFYKQQQKNKKPVESVKSISDRLYNTYGDYRQNSFGHALEQQIQIELQKNQIQLVDGWYLSRTEADLCALASMLKNAQPL